MAPMFRRCLMTRGGLSTKRFSCECLVTTKSGRKQRALAVRKRMGVQQRPTMGRKGASHEFDRTATTRRYFRRRGDRLPRPAFCFFGGDDYRKAPPLLCRLGPVGKV